VALRQRPDARVVRGAPDEGEEPVDLLLMGLACAGARGVQLPIGRQSQLQVQEVEGLDQVVQRPALHGGAHAHHVARGAEDDDVGRVGGHPHAPQDLEAARVGQVEVEQDEPGLLGLHRVECCRGGVREPGDGEALHLLDDLGMESRDTEVVLDDQRGDRHAMASAVRRSTTGR
jgi:hypothetical protein